MNRPLRVVSIAHSYSVALNRRLAHEMARAGTGRWEVTAVAPELLHGDFGLTRLQPEASESCRLEAVPLHFSKFVHGMLYGHRLRTILNHTWDVVHCWEEPYIAVGAQIARWSRPNSRLLFYTFQNIGKRYPPPFSWSERYCLDRCSGWIAAGQTVARAQLGRKCGYEERPWCILPPGVDIDRFCPNPELRSRALTHLNWLPNAPVVGFVGRFRPEKGLAMLTAALGHMPSGWNALFVGTGPMEDMLHRWAAPYGDRVRIATDVTHDRVPFYLNAMDILCVPSQTTATWREQFGRVIIEAFACGVPVIGSDSGEIPYVIGDNGLIAAEGSESAWTSVLSGLIASPERRAELAGRAAETARSTYAWPIIARRHLEFFSSILDRSAI